MNIDQIRTERNARLQASDRYMLPDYPHKSAAVREQWVRYRQALRDMMESATLQAQGDPTAEIIVLWPTPPPPVQAPVETSPPTTE